ncbi:hypothetical protein HY642_00045 [Candidatus Woesearchaeota archaeon]|nr:hypothetical protein [Candidatus Woesearchaeota archaeon]
MADIHQPYIPGEIYLWQGKPVYPSLSAQRELSHLKLPSYKVVRILEEGFNCSRSKRALGTVERCVVRGNKVYKIVVVDVGDKWLITHAGRFTVSKEIQLLRRQHGNQS